MHDRVVFVCVKCSQRHAAIYGQAVTMRCPRCSSIVFTLPAEDGKTKEPEKKAEEKEDVPAKDEDNILTRHDRPVEKAAEVNLVTGEPLKKKTSTKKSTKKKSTSKKKTTKKK